MEVEIEEQCINLLALQQPMARDLRMLTSALKIANDLERVGDHAVAGDDLIGLGAVALEQGVDRKAERRLRLARHGQEPDLEVAQLLVKMAVQVAGHPNLPVM
jgi:hypothetical protein